MGARRLGELFDRYGTDTVESCFDAIIDRTTRTYRREILGRIPVGSWVWEDYAEHDGVEPPTLHRQRITLTRTGPEDPEGERLVVDFDGTGPQARGPINNCGDHSDGVFLKKWLAPNLRNLADTPEGEAEIDDKEGDGAVHGMRVQPPGRPLTPKSARRPLRASGSSSTSPGPGRSHGDRSPPAATTATACSSRSGWRRSCPTSPILPSGWPSSTSTRGSCRSSGCGSRLRGRC